MAKEIGVGASLFLMSTKALSVLFLILFIINIPVLMFYSRGTMYKTNENTESGISDYFNMFTLSNVGGAQDTTCMEFDLKKPFKESTIQFQCQ